MRKACWLLGFLLPFLYSSGQKTVVDHLLCENKENPICVDERHPSLSWQLAESLGSAKPGPALFREAAYRNISQSAFRVLVSDDSAILQKDSGNIWDSRKVISDQSIRVRYAGPGLEAAKLYWWKVMVWDNHGKSSAWSRAGHWRVGLPDAADWHGAKWIAFDTLPDSLRTVPAVEGDGTPGWQGVHDALPLLRKLFFVHKAIRSATAYVCGLGQFCLRLNGVQVGDHFLDPGWTKYDQHALYVAFDVTQQLRKGANALGVMLGNGFYFIPGDRYRKFSGAYGHPKMICRLVISYQDGSADDIISDTSWRSAAGPVTFSSIYGGEDYDARLEQPGWDRPAFNDMSWSTAISVGGPPELDAQMAEPLKIFEHFAPVGIVQPKRGVWVYDLGQNASGIPYLEVSGKRGSVIKLTPAELTGDDGLAMQKWIGEPVTFSYTLKGSGKEFWQPAFMYYGFRYVQVEGGVPAGKPNPDQLPVIVCVQGLHTRNAAARIGSFSCSNQLFNKTFRLIDWAIQSNTSSILTDCPHREKLGWLEEAHLVGPSIRYNYDISNLLNKVIRDMIHAQTADGLIPDIAPEYTQFVSGFRDSPEWGSSGIILPWYAYQWYGDRSVLEESYAMMTRYAAFLEGKSKDHILYFGLGDWYDIGPKPPGESQLTPTGITSTAIYYYDLTILSQVAALIGKDDDKRRYDSLAFRVREAFNRTFFHPETKQYGTGSQTANAMAVYMGLVDSADKAAVLDNIVRDVQSRHNSLTAGDIGYRYLLRVLDEAGRSDVIYAMNSGSERPGYGYQLARGATALTESWQAYRNASNDHFMLGHLMEWFYSGLAGIRPSAGTIAFREIDIRPEPVGDVTSASANVESPYGLISSSWSRDKQTFHLIVRIPANARARIFLPSGPSALVSESGHAVESDRGVVYSGFQGGRSVYQVGSGQYDFLVKYSSAQEAGRAAIDYGNNPAAGKYYSLRGIRMYCETYGNGTPVLMIHGNGGNLGAFEHNIPYFSGRYRVVAVDSRAQGKSVDMGDSLSFEMMADDCAALLDAMHIDSCHVIGWSDGGIVALLLAMRHPRKVISLAATGANIWPDSTAVIPSGWLEDQKRYEEGKQIAVRSDEEKNKWKIFLLDWQQPNLQLADLHAIRCPALIISGDHDVINLEHTIQIYRNIAGAQLWVLPNSGHATLRQHADLFNESVDRFFRER
jgi:pimeloyl-ACP methyl ester carboxylesterase